MLRFVLLCIMISSGPSCVDKDESSSLSKVNDEKGRLGSYDNFSTQKTKITPEESSVKTVIKEKLLEDFEKPLYSYPLINSSSAIYGKDGLLYRKGIDIPFSGRLVDISDAGICLLEVSFLDGQPHGQQIRKNDDGIVLMEAFFSHGSLVGIKTKWWPSGMIKEEEYWDSGEYQGRRLWDENGRLIKEERTKQI